MPRDSLRWSGFDRFDTKLDDVPMDAETALFYRERHSQKGIGTRKKLQRLGARQVNQDFLDEICTIPSLVELRLEVVSAHDLTPLKRLSNLRVLKIVNNSKVTDFSALIEISTLRGLYIENAKNLNDFSFLSNAHHLVRLGLEGSMYRTCKLSSLEPLEGLRGLESLFMTSVSLKTKNLVGLAQCQNLMELHCARFAPRSEFQKLRAAMPNLSCNWCDEYDLPNPTYL
ncbi:MAG: hypothetical protein WA790_07525 [Sulfitobacter sp.]